MTDIFKVIKNIFKIVRAAFALIVTGFILLFVLALVSGVLGFETFGETIIYNIILPVITKIGTVIGVPLLFVAIASSDEPGCDRCRRGIF